MRKVSYCLAVAVVVAMACGGALAATTMWLATDTAGTAIVGDTITVAPNATVQLYAFLQSDAIGNTYELMVGYDKSDAATWGKGLATDGHNKYLVLSSTEAAIEGSMPASFTALHSAVLYASGNEDSNTFLGGRPYGFVGRAATLANASPGKVLCFSFSLLNQMPAGGNQYVVLSNKARANSYSDAWKYGTTLNEYSYALKVVSGSSLPTVGAANKAANSTLMSTVKSKYNFKFWGVVSARTTSGFTIDDGSGVPINVVAPGNTVANGNYVSVNGSLDTSTNPPTLTAGQVNKY